MGDGLRFDEALGLGVPLALGGVLATTGAVGCVWATAHLGGALVDALAGRRASWLVAGSVLLVSLLAGWLGTGLARLDPLRRWVAIGLALPTAMALGWSTTGRASVEGPLAGAAVAFALAMPGVARWFEPGAVAARGVSIGPFVAAVAGLELVLGALVLVTASFGRLFAEVGLATDWRTDLLVGLSRLVLDAGLLLAPPLLLAAVPLLRVGRRRARAATGVVLLATAFALAHTVGVPLLTCVTASWPGKL